MLGLLAAAFVLSSPEIAPNSTIAPAHVWNRDGCHGGNVSPALRWSGVPPEAKSLALVMFDPDAPTGHGWYHWLVWDVPPAAGSLGRGRVAAGAHEGRNEFGTQGYGGPCPPPGPAHRYEFTLYALRTERLGVAPGSPWTAVMQAIDRHRVAEARLEARYGR